MDAPELIRIETFFRENEDGDFLSPEPDVPYWVIGPGDRRSALVYATKSALIQGFCESEICDELGIVGRYGLPNRRDVEWLRALVGARKLLFCGDLDPPDLLIFAWLRLALAPTEVVHCAINDRFLDALGGTVAPTFFVRHSDAEKAAAELFRRVLPDLHSLVGPICADKIERGYKLEIEALVSWKESAAEVLRPSLETFSP